MLRPALDAMQPALEAVLVYEEGVFTLGGAQSPAIWRLRICCRSDLRFESSGLENQDTHLGNCVRAVSDLARHKHEQVSLFDLDGTCFDLKVIDVIANFACIITQ